MDRTVLPAARRLLSSIAAGAWGRLASLALVLVAGAAVPAAEMREAAAHAAGDETRRIAVVSAYPPEMSILRAEIRDAASHRANGVEFVTGRLEGRDVVLFLSGIGTVNAAMTVQLALDRFHIDRIVFSGIAGGVDPGLNIGDVVIADRWGQYLETVFARKVEGGWEKPPFFEYPFANFGMMFPRSVTAVRAGSTEPETRFWFPVDTALLDSARRAAAGLALERCAAEAQCLPQPPRIVLGGSGVSGGAFIDNAEFRDYAFRTFEARVLDMESAAAAHVAWANGIPFLAVRSLSDLAGGSGQANRIGVFFQLAANNAARVVMALLAEIGAG